MNLYNKAVASCLGFNALLDVAILSSNWPLVIMKTGRGGVSQ